MTLKKCILLAMTAAAFAASLSAQDLAVKASPEIYLPLGADATLFKAGFGAEFRVDAELFGFLSPSLEAGLAGLPLDGPSGSVSLSRFGAGLGYVLYPSARLKLRLGASGGLYSAAYDADKAGGLYWKALGEAGYRFTPGFSLSVSAGYLSCLQPGEPFFQGLGVGIVADLSVGVLGERGSGVALSSEQSERIFPISYDKYASRRIGTIRVENREQGEIRDLELSFQAGGYSAGPVACGRAAYLGRGKSIEFPLYAALGESVLGITESTKIEGEATLRYRLLDKAVEDSQSVALSILHRNALTWEDERAVAAFVSPNDPAVLDLSKYLAGLVRERARPEIDKGLQYAMGIFEGLRLAGIVRSVDPSTPYAASRASPENLDYLQYPFQTLAYRGGDSDDVAVLYAAALESVGIKTGLVFLPGEVLVAARLDMAEAEARTAFVGAIDAVGARGHAWILVSTDLMREGFMRAWQAGSAKWAAASSSGKAPSILELAEGWKEFPARGVPGVDFRPPKPSEAQVSLAFENAMQRFVSREVEPRAKRLLAEMGSGGGTGRQRNALGILYARHGLVAEAEAEFEKAAAAGYAPAVTNLANAAYLRKDYERAVKWYEEALRKSPDNKAALIGLARAKYELDAYAEADDLYARVMKADPALAQRYAYLSSRIEGSASRAASSDRDGFVAWEEEE